MTDLTIISNDENKKSSGLVLDRLEEALAMAKEGNISSCVVIMVSHNGDVVDCWAEGGKPFVIVGALESLKLRFYASTY